MSLQAKILNLVSGIDDPTIRIEVSRTIYYLFSVYQSGKVPEENIVQDLYEICLTVIVNKHPELSQEEAKNRAKQLAHEILNAFRIETMLRRTIGRLRI